MSPLRLGTDIEGVEADSCSTGNLLTMPRLISAMAQSSFLDTSFPNDRAQLSGWVDLRHRHSRQQPRQLREGIPRLDG